ncbi:MAG: hypothetical protein BGO26_07725 [Actinobacteria bacterium 69-20]|nr:alpha/beta hydrolase [Actinomycetota bacterium]OJV30229.1 MAG: hypothetical protein BGO26_07725 [Actinobacteria bacterium 69-20]
MPLPVRNFGPRPRDELTRWSTAPLAHDTLAPIPGFAAEPPPAEVVTVCGQDVLVRRTDGPARAPHTWYIHGLDGASTNWDRLAAALNGHSTGFAMDLPGSGRSEPPRDGDYSITREAKLCASLIERVSRGPVHLVGNSRGGVVATYLAARFPQLVRTLTLVSPAVPDLRLAGERGADPKLALVMLPGIRPWVVRQLALISPAQRASALAAVCFGEPERLSPADLAAAEHEFRERSAFPWMRDATVMSLRSLIRAQMRPGPWSYAAACRSVRVPVLIVWGTRDRLVDARLARRTVRDFADGRLLMLARTGHVAQMERPAQVARAMLALWRAATPVDRRAPAARDVQPLAPGAPEPAVLDGVAL